jgi:hypothetical protein
MTPDDGDQPHLLYTNRGYERRTSPPSFSAGIVGEMASVRPSSFGRAIGDCSDERGKRG